MSQARGPVPDPHPAVTPAASSPIPGEARLQEQYAEIAQLAGGLAHEIRNPLSTMRLNLDLLAEDFENPESARDRRIRAKIDRVRSESLRLENLLDSFLRFVRVREFRIEPADLNAIVDDLRAFLEPLAASQGVVIRTHLDPRLPLVPQDVELIRQHVLFNLMRNAQLAMPEGGELLLITRPEPAGVILEVIDTGCGIEPELRNRIFEPFFTTRRGGTGLGLAMARKVVEAHHGSIDVESEPGKGSKFRVHLPCVATAQPSASAGQSSVPDPIGPMTRTQEPWPTAEPDLAPGDDATPRRQSPLTESRPVPN